MKTFLNEKIYNLSEKNKWLKISYYEKNFSHDGQIVSDSENKKIISPAKTGVHASYMYYVYMFLCICYVMLLLMFMCIIYVYVYYVYYVYYIYHVYMYMC